MLKTLKRLIKRARPPESDWTLNTAQMNYMTDNHNTIQAAFDAHDTGPLDALAESDEFKALFGEMNWNEAFDRYECAFDGNEDADFIAKWEHRLLPDGSLDFSGLKRVVLNMETGEFEDNDDASVTD